MNKLSSYQLSQISQRSLISDSRSTYNPWVGQVPGYQYTWHLSWLLQSVRYSVPHQRMLIKLWSVVISSLTDGLKNSSESMNREFLLWISYSESHKDSFLGFYSSSSMLVILLLVWILSVCFLRMDAEFVLCKEGCDGISSKLMQSTLSCTGHNYGNSPLSMCKVIRITNSVGRARVESG